VNDQISSRSGADTQPTPHQSTPGGVAITQCSIGANCQARRRRKLRAWFRDIPGEVRDLSMARVSESMAVGCRLDRCHGHPSCS
jgi:hypothetical protein